MSKGVDKLKANIQTNRDICDIYQLYLLINVWMLHYKILPRNQE